MRGFIALLLVAAMAHADDAKPLPVRRSVILSSGGKYFVEGRKELRWGQELSVQNRTKIVGRGHGAMLVVSGALQVRGVEDREVVIEDLTIVVAERCERVHFEAVKLNRCTIRTVKDKTCMGNVFLEECDLFETSIDLRLYKGEFTILNSKAVGAIKLIAVPKPGKRAVVKALFNTSNIDRELRVEGLNALVVRGCSLTNKVSFLDCAKLTFDGNVVKSAAVVFEQSKAGRFKNTKLQKSDFHGTSLIFKAPRDGKKKDRIPIDKCWFGGLTKKSKILAKYIEDGHTQTTSGVYVVFRKINKRELKLGGKTTRAR